MANTPDKRALLLLPSLFLLSLHGGGGKGIKRVTLSFSSPLLLFLLVILEKWKVFANPFSCKIFFCHLSYLPSFRWEENHVANYG